MLVGILSDSHGDASETAKAVSLLLERGATRLFHCGDICGEGVLDELAGHECVFVWGNCDDPSPMLQGYVLSLGLPWPAGPLHLTVAHKKIAVYHGHERGFAHAVDRGGFDYLFYGHTHRYADDRRGGCRCINPGALHRAKFHTVALLDLATDHLAFLRVDNGSTVEVAR